MEKIKIVLTLLILLILSCSPRIFKEHWTERQAPEVFKARFETTKGNFVIEAHRQWSPYAVDRLYQLIISEFYTDIALHRVVPNYVVQFGIHSDSIINNSWQKFKVPDEDILEKNVEGAISFARDGKETRSTQLFINLKSNSPRLDTIFYKGVRGFPVIAKVTKGMNVVKSFYNKYGEAPRKTQDSIQRFGNNYLKKNFPGLDYIKKAYILNK